MSFLLINLMVFAVVAAVGVFAYARMLPAAGLDDWRAAAPREPAARKLDDAVFRFAVPGEGLVLGPVTGGGAAGTACPARQRSRARRWS